MSLSAGTRLGPYAIAAPLGAGGMGEVSRARDTKLGREVALKVVAESFTHDPDRVARFHREAQLLAALNHPHIATIYGLEEAQGSQFLVMELVEGETLADRSRQQISTSGGARPVWSRNGRELVFSSSRQMLAVPVQPGTTLVAGRPQVLFEFAMAPVVGGTRPWDLAPDGRFVIIRSGQADADGSTSSNLILVQNWFEELKRLVPVN